MFTFVLSNLEFSIRVLVDMRFMVLFLNVRIVFLIETNNGHYEWMNQKQPHWETSTHRITSKDSTAVVQDK